MIKRTLLKQTIQRKLETNRVVALIGPRQCGKTTLAREFVSPSSVNYFDLEDPLSQVSLDQPMTTLQDLTGLVVIDEIQRRPEIFSVLRVLADRTPLPAHFLILGSASPALLRQSSESLAGRISTIPMSGFNLEEVGAQQQNKLWRRGGFPLSFIAPSEEASLDWRRDFVRTFLERDIPQFGFNIPSTSLFRFWSLLAHYHGQVWNAAEAARTLNVSEGTSRRYVDLLQDLFMVRLLQPWHANLGKRQVKSPKVYIRDTGLLHALLGIRTEQELLLHPRSGASWEGFAIEEVINAVSPDEAYFWGTHSGAELDLLLLKDGKRIGVECKRVDAPRLTPSMRTAVHDLELSKLFVIFPGSKPYPLTENIQAIPLASLAGPAANLFDQFCPDHFYNKLNCFTAVQFLGSRRGPSRMQRIIRRRILREFWEKHPDASISLQTWFHDVERAAWNTPSDIKMVYQNASFVANNRVVFNIKGNHYRLVVLVVYQCGVVYIRFVGTHEEYDRIDVNTI